MSFRLILAHFVLPYPAMPQSVTHPKLAHLTREEINTLIQAYYTKQKVSDLMQRFHIDCLPQQLYKLFPPEVSSELCPNCGTHLIMPRISQSANRNEYKNGLRCPQCPHRKATLCTCPYCRGNKKSQKALSPTNITRASRTPAPLKAADLSMEHAVALLALMRCDGPTPIKSKLAFRPASTSKVPLAPTGRYEEELVSRLVEAGLLKVLDPARTKSMGLSENKRAVTLSTQWSLPCAISSELIREIETRVSGCAWPESWYEQLFELAFDLALAECRQFYDYCAIQRMFPETDEKSINALLGNLLEDFSTGQCFRIIQSGAQYAADFMVKQRATPAQAAYYMVGACQRWANKARADNNWIVLPFRRNFHCPRSMMSYMLYDVILKIQDEGLGTPIALLQLPAEK